MLRTMTCRIAAILLAGAAVSGEARSAQKDPPGKPRGTTITGPGSRLIMTVDHDRPDPTGAGRAKYPPINTPPGVLSSIACTHRSGMDIRGAASFSKPAPNSGTVNPNALVARAQLAELTLAMAFDSAKPDSPHFDLVRLDFTGKGDFTKATVVRRCSTTADHRTREVAYRFAERPLEITVNGRKIVAEFIAVYREGQRPQADPVRSAYLSLSTGAQGTCRFGKKLHAVRLMDRDHNLTVTDPIKTFTPEGWPGEKGDWFMVDIGDGTFDQAVQGYGGHPVLIDGALFDVTVSDGGTKVSAKPFAGEVGSVRINHPGWRASLRGGRYGLEIHGGPQPVTIPAGRYAVRSYREWATGEMGRRQTHLYLSQSARSPSVDVLAGQTAEISIGTPLSGSMTATQRGRTVVFALNYADVGGMDVWFRHYGTGGRRETGKIRITDAAGRPADEVTVNWHSDRVTWKLPPGLAGTFTATMPDSLGPFRMKTDKLTFTVGKGS